MVAYGYHRTHLNSWNLDKEEQCMWHKCLHYLIQKGATSCLKLDASDEQRVHFWWSNEHISTNHNTCLSLNNLNSSYVFEPTNNLTFNAFGWLGEFQSFVNMCHARSIFTLCDEVINVAIPRHFEKTFMNKLYIKNERDKRKILARAIWLSFFRF